ncbi:glutamate cyclase domain-containing protein [Congregibacter sp.]|uniref:glutamate cyclase domain-containing protein n=1 Tax=Congregibacter sp. TaxID=2744308 RepID=UPI003F6CFEF0
MNLTVLSDSIEALLVEKNLRRMAELRPALTPGYCLRAARLLEQSQRVLIGTGFPVLHTFETDGPLGAIALYRALEHLGKDCHLACADPLASALGTDFKVLKLEAFDLEKGLAEARDALASLKPDVVLSIERPGLAADQRYYNMRGEDISPRCAIFDYYLTQSQAPSIAIGDGGNEIGMGKLQAEVSALDIHGAATSCDELLVADVSNWGGYGLIAVLEALTQTPLLELITHDETLRYLSEHGSIDGVTRENTLTEDGLPAAAGAELLTELQRLVNTHNRSMDGAAEGPT